MFLMYQHVFAPWHSDVPCKWDESLHQSHTQVTFKVLKKGLSPARRQIEMITNGSQSRTCWGLYCKDPMPFKTLYAKCLVNWLLNVIRYAARRREQEDLPRQISNSMSPNSYSKSMQYYHSSSVEHLIQYSCFSTPRSTTIQHCERYNPEVWLLLIQLRVISFQKSV